MRFHLDFKPQKSEFQINHSHGLFLVGSCFTEHIGAKLLDLHFTARVNPTGIIYNPLSIHSLLNDAIVLPKVNFDFMLESERLHFSFLHHSKIKANNQNQLVQLIESNNLQNQLSLKSSKVLIITFGSAYYYYHKKLGITVANCHKQNQQVFEKKICTVKEIVEKYSQIIKSLLALNASLKIIFTVSPVKHLKDGLVENNISKSTLILGINEICNTHSSCFYFPAFELVNDDLRDYRFYKQDLAHPNDQAIDYVWSKFSETFFDTNTKKINFEIEKLNAYLKHTHLHQSDENEVQSDKFILNQKEIIQHLLPQIQF